MLLFVWAPILAIGLLHYNTGHELGWAHNVLRRLYYLPIVVAALHLGLRGGLMAALVVSLTYLPHAFLGLGDMVDTDPGTPVEKGLEMLVYNAVGAVAGFLADAERQRRVQLKLALDAQRSLQQQLVRAGRLGALGEVVAGIAHEIKNPLHALKGTAEIVDSVIPEDTAEHRMWQIHRSEIDRLGRVAERFLSFARPAAPVQTRVDLRDVADRLVDLIRADAKNKRIELEVVLPTRPVVAHGDRDQLAQVALNIALNATNAIGLRGGRIRVGVLERHQTRCAGMCALVIENDGPPIPDDAFEQLFDPFHGTDAATTGLGLSISERIAEQHGGFIEAANAGLGVTFTLCLPRTDSVSTERQ